LPERSLSFVYPTGLEHAFEAGDLLMELVPGGAVERDVPPLKVDLAFRRPR
jgi:hypothetical protein